MGAKPKTKKSETVEFHVRKPDTPNEEVSVSVGDGLCFCGPYKKSRSAFVKGAELNTDDLVLIGSPPMGTTMEDLHAGGIVGVVKLRDVQAMAGTGDWTHVPASKLGAALAKVEAAKKDRTAPAPAPAPASEN